MNRMGSREVFAIEENCSFLSGGHVGQMYEPSDAGFASCDLLWEEEDGGLTSPDSHHRSIESPCAMYCTKIADEVWKVPLYEFGNQ